MAQRRQSHLDMISLSLQYVRDDRHQVRRVCRVLVIDADQLSSSEHDTIGQLTSPMNPEG